MLFPLLALAAGAVPSTPASETSVAAAMQVVRDYYAAVSRHDYRAAFNLWHGAKSFGRFRAGYAATRRVRVTFLKPGETEGTIRENVDFIRDNGVRFYSLKEFFYMPHTQVHEKRNDYGLTGMGGKWSHRTMNHEDAARIKLDLFRSIDNSTNIDPDTSLWYMAYLYDQGYDFKAIEKVQAGINGLMKHQLETADSAQTWATAPASHAELDAAE